MNLAVTAVEYSIRSAQRGRYAPLFVVGSIVFHIVGFMALNQWVKRQPPPPKKPPMELVMIEVKPPPPPPPPEEKKEEPPPKPPPVKVAKVNPPKEIPKEQPPPPPNEEPPPETPPKVAPIITGISMNSTSDKGTVAVNVGNTLMGASDKVAKDPAEVKPYAAPKYLPSYQVDSPPEKLHEITPDYPSEARQAGIEGQVILSITVDAEGKVVKAKVLRGLGYGLDEAALEGLKRYRFKPAMKGGEAVSTTINWTVTFLLD